MTDDAFGHVVKDYYDGENCFEIVERDDGLIEATSPEKYFKEYEEWNENEKEVIKHAKGKIIDIGAGVGRHSLYLQKQGKEVLATDKSPLAVKVCEKRGLKNTKILDIRNIDELNQELDTVLLLGNNFGLVGGRERSQEILKKIDEVTSEEALILASTTNPNQTDDPKHLEYHEKNREEGKMPGLLRLRVRYKKYKGEWLNYLLVSKKEMKQILEDTVWRVKEFVDKDEEPHYCAVIEKK